MYVLEQCANQMVQRVLLEGDPDHSLSSLNLSVDLFDSVGGSSLRMIMGRHRIAVTSSKASYTSKPLSAQHFSPGDPQIVLIFLAKTYSKM